MNKIITTAISVFINLTPSLCNTAGAMPLTAKRLLPDFILHQVPPPRRCRRGQNKRTARRCRYVLQPITVCSVIKFFTEPWSLTPYISSKPSIVFQTSFIGLPLLTYPKHLLGCRLVKLPGHLKTVAVPAQLPCCPEGTPTPGAWIDHHVAR